jgi:hypothetical protein
MAMYSEVYSQSTFKTGETTMYYHVIENAQRNGAQVYVHVKTYKRWQALDTYVRKTGKPVWIIDSRTEYLREGTNPGAPYGGFIASYYNTGGYGVTTMPVLPLHAK